jgi:hypothetical protein
MVAYIVGYFALGSCEGMLETANKTYCESMMGERTTSKSPCWEFNMGIHVIRDLEQIKFDKRTPEIHFG